MTDSVYYLLVLILVLLVVLVPLLLLLLHLLILIYNELHDRHIACTRMSSSSRPKRASKLDREKQPNPNPPKKTEKN